MRDFSAPASGGMSRLCLAQLSLLSSVSPKYAFCCLFGLFVVCLGLLFLRQCLLYAGLALNLLRMA